MCLGKLFCLIAFHFKRLFYLLFFFFLLLVLLCFLFFFIYGFYVLNKCSPKVPLPLTPFLFLACLSRRSTQEGNHFVQILVNGFSFSSSSKSNLLAGSFFFLSLFCRTSIYFSLLYKLPSFIYLFFLVRLANTVAHIPRNQFSL